MAQVDCEWGPNGVTRLSQKCDIVVIVDVLSFSTSVDIATGRSMRVYPYSGSLEDAPEFARMHDAELALPRGWGQFSLSPREFEEGPYAERVVAPSPNGSTLTLLAAERAQVLCGCLRNAGAIAGACAGLESVGLVPAGEKWPDGSLRPALEDWLGAGAIISHIDGDLSPEARAAAASFENLQHGLLQALRSCPSGLELIEKGYERDVEIASLLDTSQNVPRFIAPAF